MSEPESQLWRNDASILASLFSIKFIRKHFFLFLWEKLKLLVANLLATNLRTYEKHITKLDRDAP